MKKMFFQLILMLSIATLSFAAADETSIGTLSVGGTNGTETLTIGLSQGVTARYLGPGVAMTDAQWYAIATVHQGGNRAYGTGQDVNNIYFRDTIPGDDPNTALTEIPVEKNPQPGDPVPDTSEGAADGAMVTPEAATWTNNGWVLN